MDSSKLFQEWCSSSESGWTTYIVSQDPDEEDSSRGNHRGNKKGSVHVEDVESDDSMASDASSGPSEQRWSYECIRSGKKNEKKYVSKKHSQQEDKNYQKNAGKDKSVKRANSAGRSKKT